MRVIFKIEYTPNSINLWTRVRDDLKKRGNIEVKGSNFNLLGDYTEKRMLRAVQRTHDERLDTTGL